MTFDAKQYAIEGGWDHDCIVATAQFGVSDEDETRITDWMRSQGYEGGELDAAVDAATEALLAYCHAAVT